MKKLYNILLILAIIGTICMRFAFAPQKSENKLFVDDVVTVGTSIVNKNGEVNNGAHFENFIAQQLVANGFEPYFCKKNKIGEFQNMEYKVIDIQEIPFEDGYFDIVIANYMLYHVPDIDKAVSEVSRVLKKGGHFYAGTTGENGIMETVVKILGVDLSYANTFSLENGKEKIAPYFAKIEIKRYVDSLEVTNIDDLMDYIYSGITFKNACKMSPDEVRNKLLSCMEDGILRLPKDPGMFVAIK